jgi:hypothetical protein
MGAVPFWSTSSMDLFVPGIDTVRKLGNFTFTISSPDYFRTMGTRIIAGRPFDATDRAGTPPVVVVSQGMARVLWPGEDALGKCIHLDEPTAPCATVIGVSEDVVERDLTGSSHYSYFIPAHQFQPENAFVLAVRAEGDATALVEPLRRRLQQEMTGSAYISVDLFGTVVAGRRRSWEAGATMFLAFGLLALGVAAVGTYSVVAYHVAQRSHEMGVRVALGASIGDIARMVMMQGARLGGGGVLIGVGITLGIARFAEPLLYKQSPFDPVVYGAVVLVILAMSVLASGVPAWRAARVDPNAALRAD